jgi:hypothetical protein
MKRILLMTGAVLGAAVLTLPQRAEACGGFFCSRTPIDQSGEKIAFAVGKDGIEVHVQIQYVGDAKQFSWVVPLHAKPELSIGSPQFFSYLDNISAPRFQLDWQQSNSCNSRGGFGLFPSAAETDASAPNAGGVTVVSQESVGPYAAATLQATDAKALTDWLTNNGYDLTEAGKTAIAGYVGPDYYFVALKLQQDKGTGDLRPIVLKMSGAPPCIPIKLTAIAARPNMPIIAYVFSDTRSVPQNYRHVLINESKIDWLNGGSNYRQVANDAVDEAGGKAFLTEFAGSVKSLTGQTGGLRQLDRYDTAKLSLIPHPVDFAAELMNQGFAQDPSIQSLLRKYIPMPASLVGKITEQQFYNQLSQYRAQIDSDPGRLAFKAGDFALELQQTIVEPLQGAQKILDTYPYLTRLFTTMSAEEMDVDPEFQFNPDVGDVSNVHRAKATMVSGCEVPFNQQKVKIELADGRWFYQTFSTGPITDGPSAARVESIESSGAPVVLMDNTAAINKVIEGVGGHIPGAGCGGCSSVDGFSAALLALGAVSTGLLRRRSRR